MPEACQPLQLEVLNTLDKNDTDGKYHCVRLLEWFDYRGHVCMVFEKLGLSLYDFLKKNSYRPFHLDLVRQSKTQSRAPTTSLVINIQMACSEQTPYLTSIVKAPGSLT